jgi:hypothetical protein
VQTGDVILGNQTASNIAIQVIDYNFSAMPSLCSQLQPDVDPCGAGFNGIMGVGMFTYDCGADCVSSNPDTNTSSSYFACASGNCGDFYQGSCGGTGQNASICAIGVPLSQQVVNPIAKFASGFNNGIAFTLPDVALSGGAGVAGTMTFGIGTQGNNTPPGSSVAAYPADPNGMSDTMISDFQTSFGGVTYGAANGGSQAFIDSGSNGYFFSTQSPLVDCPVNSQFFCTTTPQSYPATIMAFSGTPASPQQQVLIGNADTLFASSNSAFKNVGASSSTGFVWGLPFFYNKTVYVGFDGTTATFSGAPHSGPYWAF